MVGFFRASVKLSADRPVKFRMIVFRPFKGEIMMGKIASGTEHGIKSEY
jgi:DNA-directed RNA polymerase subunit E'/Rpb7